MTTPKINVLFVCMGNICRSPTAEGVFTHLVREKGLDELIAVDSAGTLEYHAGEEPDHRAQETALAHGVDISGLRARQVAQEDFDQFQYIIVMDETNLSDIQPFKPPGFKGELALFCDYIEDESESEVPDPYTGGIAGFQIVYGMVTDASQGLLNAIVDTHLPDHAPVR